MARSGIAVRVVPGITAACGVAASTGVPLTHRDHCSSFTVVTGHENPETGESSIDWEQLARTPGTKVVLMGLKHIRSIAERLVSHGMAASTPVAMISWGTTARQQSI